MKKHSINMFYENKRIKHRLKNLFILIGIIAFLLISISCAVMLGATDINPDIVFRVIFQELFSMTDESLKLSEIYIIWNLRIPRILMSIAVGGGLAICGVAMQSITQNVLADPYILGVSGGASAAASFVFYLGGVFTSNSNIANFAAFIGAIIAMTIVYRIGSGARSGTRLVLAGMAISIVFNAISQLFISLSPPEIVKNISLWMMGSLAEARWDNIGIPLLASFIGLVIFCANAKTYDLISLGNETAISMGVCIEDIRRLTMFLVAFITGVIVASCGIIGLVGFVIPHIVRILIGADHRKMFPISYLVGGIYMIWMDMLARFVLAPQELPIGIFTAIFAGPFFIILLYRQGNKGRG